jgi:hypothetical protein
MIDAIVERLVHEAGDPWERDAEAVPMALVGHIVGPGGRAAATATTAVRAECEMAPELLRTGLM